MSWKDRYVRAAPTSLSRSDRRSEPPALRESFIRTKPSALDAALDAYCSGGTQALEGFDPNVVATALRIRVAVDGPAACAAFGERTVPVIAAMLDERLGVEIACECAAAFPRAAYVNHLFAICLDGDAGERIGAEEALRKHVGMLSAGFAELRTSAASRTTVQDRRCRGIRLLATLGDELSLHLFVALLGDTDRTVARAAHSALRELTCHDLGLMRAAWQRWAEKNGHNDRLDWMIEALVDRREPLRRAALLGLVDRTGESFGLSESQPHEAFLAGQARFVEWRRRQLSGL